MEKIICGQKINLETLKRIASSSKEEFGWEWSPTKIVNSDLRKVEKLCQKCEKGKDITLYRVVWSKTPPKTGNLGLHYVEDPKDFHDDMLDILFNLARKKNPNLDYGNDGYLLKAKIPACDIDFWETLTTRAEHPFEEEVMLKTDKNAKLLKASKFE